MAVKALLLAAGLGTRLRPYTNKIPKPCIPFWGLPIMYYSFFLLKKTSCRQAAVNLHHLPEQIRDLCAQKNLSDFDIRFSLEKEKPYGSGGAIYYAKELLQGADHFFAINSDEVMVPSSPDILNRLYKHHTQENALATLLVTDHPELMKTLKPVWVNNAGHVKAFGEKPASTDELKPVHYTGYKIFSKDILTKIPPGETNIFHEILKKEIAAGARVSTLHDVCAWWETGNFNSLLSAMDEVIKNSHHQDYIQSIFKEFGFNYDYEILLSKNLTLAKHRTAQTNSAQMSGTVFIDSGSTIAPGSTVENAIIGAKSRSGSLKNQMILPGENLC